MSKTLPWTTPYPSLAAPKNGLLVIASDLPVVYEDEGQEQLGDTYYHFMSESILFFGIQAHLADRPKLQALPNMNLYYHPTDRVAYVSPDVMVVKPRRKVSRRLRSYRVGEQGPAPMFVAEVLSRRTFQQGDLTIKPIIYAELGVAEYLLADVTGEFLPEKLLIRYLDADGNWSNQRDRDGGVTSALGFRVVIDEDEELRVIEAATGRKYLRPDEVNSAENARLAAENARLAAEKRIAELEAENARLKSKPRDRKK